MSQFKKCESTFRRSIEENIETNTDNTVEERWSHLKTAAVLESAKCHVDFKR